jgi:hypothetical protein
MLFVLLLGLVCLQQADRVLGEEIQGSGHNIPAILKRSSTIIFPARKANNFYCFCFAMVSICRYGPRMKYYLNADPDLDPESHINAGSGGS